MNHLNIDPKKFGFSRINRRDFLALTICALIAGCTSTDSEEDYHISGKIVNQTDDDHIVNLTIGARNDSDEINKEVEVEADDTSKNISAFEEIGQSFTIAVDVEDYGNISEEMSLDNDSSIEIHLTGRGEIEIIVWTPGEGS